MTHARLHLQGINYRVNVMWNGVEVRHADPSQVLCCPSGALLGDLASGGSSSVCRMGEGGCSEPLPTGRRAFEKGA